MSAKHFQARRSCASPLSWSSFTLIVRSVSGNAGDEPGANATTTFGVIPLCQMRLPEGVSHSSMASNSAEPSGSGWRFL